SKCRTARSHAGRKAPRSWAWSSDSSPRYASDSNRSQPQTRTVTWRRSASRARRRVGVEGAPGSWGRGEPGVSADGDDGRTPDQPSSTEEATRPAGSDG